MLGTMLPLRQARCDFRCLLCLFALQKPLNHLFTGGTLLPAETVELCQQGRAGFPIDLPNWPRAFLLTPYVPPTR